MGFLLALRRILSVRNLAPLLVVVLISAADQYVNDDYVDLLTDEPVHDRVKRAATKNKHKDEDTYDYTDSQGKLKTADWTNIKFCFFCILGFVLMIIQLWTCIFGRRMRNDGTRWHVLYVTIFMIINLFVFVDVDEDSPWQDYMRNVYVTVHQKAIQWVTLSAFPASITIMVPIYLISYGASSLRGTYFFKWFLWVIVYGALFGANGFLALLYYKALDGDGQVPTGTYLEAYQFYICKFSDLIDLFMLWFNIVIVTTFVATQNLMNSFNYIMLNVVPTVTEYMKEMKSSSSSSDTTSGSSLDMASLLELADKLKPVVSFLQTTQLYIPVAFYFANVICLPAFRESFISLLTCGACYRSDKDGSCWTLIPNRYRSIYPLEALRWANPSLIAQGIVPPPPASMNIGNGGPLAFVSQNDKKQLMVEHLE
uniref:Transmembrane protein n=1 Tax=Bursaphelenchus xylophilus TaxID=6326 RepID=A0A1I7S4T5_BURXY